MKTKNLYLAISCITLVTLACTCGALPDLTSIANDLATPTAASSSGGSAATKAPGTTSVAPKPTAGKYDTVFPLPTSVKNFTGTGKEGPINFQTDMAIKDVLTFYRKEFATMGLKERTINTVITDSTFSLVFDGYPNGKATVIQSVSLGATSTNVNIRFENLP